MGATHHKLCHLSYVLSPNPTPARPGTQPEQKAEGVVLPAPVSRFRNARLS